MREHDRHPGDDHEILRAYLADELGPEERHELEDHLADCGRCRACLVATHDEGRETELASPPVKPWLDRARSQGRDRSRVSYSLRLAAGLAVVLLGGLLGLLSSTRPATPPDLDSGNEVFRLDDPVQTLRLTSPAVDQLLPPGPVDLHWTPVVDARRYRVFLLDHGGVPVATHRTEATWWRWTRGTIAEFWYVEAELNDGTRIESDARQLIFVPTGSESPDSPPGN